MPSLVPHLRTNPYYRDVQISAAVRGREWRELGHLYHWIRGHGMHLIPAHAPRLILAASTPRTLRWRVHPSGRAIARVWWVVVRGDATAVELTFPDGLTDRVVASPYEVVNGLGLPGALHVEELASKSSALTELTLVCESDGAAIVESVCCWELPRAALTQGDADDLGVEIESLRAGASVYDDGAGDARSLAALVAHLDVTDCRRSLLQYAHETVSVQASPAVDLYTLPIPILPRKGGRSDTSRFVRADIYARATTAATQGIITIATAVAGDAITVNLDGTTDGTSFQWYEPGNIEAACEDLAEPDGLPGGVWETVQVTLERTAGAGAIELESESIWEAP